MQDFGKLLRTYLIEKNDYSISAFAKNIGISAGLLNHIFNNKRTMSPEKFLLTINSPVFDLNEKQELRDAYFTNRYGETDYKKIKLLCENIENFQFGDAPEINDCNNIIRNGYGEIFSYSEAYSAIKELFETTENIIYTNIHHSNNAINHVLYKLKKDFSDSELVRFIPTFTSKVTERGLTELFSIIRFAKLGVNTLSLEKTEVEHLEHTTLFPYFVISDKMMILLDAQCKKGVAFCSENIVKDKYRITEKASKNAVSVVTYFKNEIEAVNYIINYEGQKISAFKSTPCFLAVDDLSFLTEAAADFPDKDELLSFLQNRRSDKQWCNICTQTGLEKFLETGKTYELSSNFIKNFPIESRKSFIKSLIATLEEDKMYHNSFLERSIKVANFFENIDFAVYENSCLIATIYDNPGPDTFLSEISIHITGGDLLKTLKTFLTDYLPLSGEVLSKQTTLLYLKGMQIELQRRSQ